MFDELKKSISASLYERTTSPFYGTLFVSWSVWNWKIIYLTLFISEKEIIGKTKIEYILENYYDNYTLYWFPLISTIILITIIPLVSNGAYWLSLIYLDWKKRKKNEIEKKQLLSIEQSIDLREQISNQEIKFTKLVEDKNLEIKQLNLIIDSLKGLPEKTIENQKNIDNSGETELTELAERIKVNEYELNQFNTIIKLIQGGYALTENNGADSKFVSLLESYDIINPNGKGIYMLLPNGKKLNKLLNK
jgi:hypothetical protein